MTSKSTRPSLIFDRWPRFAYRRPRLVLAAAGGFLISLAILWSFVGEPFSDSFSIPGSESQALVDLLDERFPDEAGDSATVVLQAEAGLDDPAVVQRVESLLVGLAGLPDVTAVTSPYGPPGAISEDGTIARIEVQYNDQQDNVPDSSAKALLAFRVERSQPGFVVEVGGDIPRFAEREPPGTSEAIGGVAAVFILLIAFGSVVAMGLPLIAALFALTCGFFIIGIGAAFFHMPDFTAQFAAMIGIGVGIDYALLIVTRFREGRARGLNIEDAIAKSAATSGRTVVFAGATVIISLLGLWAAGLPFMGWVGTAAAVVVLFAVVAAIFVLPAILALVGNYIDRWRLPFLAVPAFESETGMGYRLARMVQRAPLLFLGLSLSILLLLAAPVLDLEIGTTDAGNDPESHTARRAYDLLSDGFGPGFNGPLLVGFRVDEPAAEAKVAEVAALIAQTDGIVGVSPPVFNEARDAAVFIAVPATSPQSGETTTLVQDLRESVDEPFLSVDGEALVGGSTAAFVDIDQKVRDSLPIFLAAIIGLSFILLMVLFRSIVVPIKAALMNLLSIGAAYGVLVAVFQWGWLAGFFGVASQGPIESFLPMMMFAILFGLSMDYEVFLVSRIREEYLRTGDNTEAVARGLSVTTRVITAAAAIMVAVFLSFAVSEERVVKQAGMGLATAIFLDATLVRLILVPSAMQVMGRINWWFPSWLDRIVPRISIESDQPTPPDESAFSAAGD